MPLSRPQSVTDKNRLVSESPCMARKRQAVLALAVGAAILKVVFYSSSHQLNSDSTADHDEVLSTSSPKADERGPNQKVVAYSFYGVRHHRRRYYEGIWMNADRVRSLYPGWVMRLYHDLEPSSSLRQELEVTARKYPHLDLCYVAEIPGYGDLTGAQQNAWRFLAMADPLVDVFLSRDTDAMPLYREVAAVDQWLASNLTFHVMRDNIYHIDVILAGMWGARLKFQREMLRQLAEDISLHPKGDKQKDQELLARKLWPYIKGDVMQHDSYHCRETRFTGHGHVMPFPTQRNATAICNYVGNLFAVNVKPTLQICPEPCRPKHHPDWLYC